MWGRTQQTHNYAFDLDLFCSWPTVLFDLHLSDIWVTKLRENATVRIRWKRGIHTNDVVCPQLFAPLKPTRVLSEPLNAMAAQHLSQLKPLNTDLNLTRKTWSGTQKTYQPQSLPTIITSFPDINCLKILVKFHVNDFIITITMEI